ncbi:hypothetical protein [Butyrivibrio sp. AE3004]|uniref:hypothetical protein n=1 Tax=Butyrivibrio sp. AE3004 TaxID=1506994 RepID=UPI00056B0534|nr:hypothetical protein [Butyrivibrio sp. AE3004]
MKKIKILIEQTLMVSFMTQCYVSLYGLLVMKKYGYQFDWYIPGSIVIASFLCSLITVFLLYGKSDRKNYSILIHYIRVIAHFILLYVIIMGIGYLCYWYRGIWGFILTSVIYVIIYAGTWVGTILIFRHEEKLISKALDNIRDDD